MNAEAAGLARDLAEIEMVDGVPTDWRGRKNGRVYLAEQIAYVVTAELGLGWLDAVAVAEDAVAAVAGEQRSAA